MGVRIAGSKKARQTEPAENGPGWTTFERPNEMEAEATSTDNSGRIERRRRKSARRRRGGLSVLLVVLAAVAAFGYFGRSEPKDGMVPAAVAGLVALLLVVISRAIGRRDGTDDGASAAGHLLHDEADVVDAEFVAAPSRSPEMQLEMAVEGRAALAETGAVAAAEAGSPMDQPNGVVGGDRVNGLFGAVGSATERASAVEDEPASREAPPPLWGSPRARADALRRQNAGEVLGRAQGSAAAQVAAQAKVDSPMNLFGAPPASAAANSSLPAPQFGDVDDVEATLGLPASPGLSAGLQTEPGNDRALQFPAQGDRANGYDAPSGYEPPALAGVPAPSGFDPAPSGFDPARAFDAPSGFQTSGYEGFELAEPTPAAERPLDMAAAAVRPRLPEMMAWHTDDELREVGELLVALHRRFGLSYRSRTWIEEVLPTCSLTPMDPLLTRDLLAAAALEAGGVAVDRASFSLLRDEVEVNNAIGHLHMALIELEARLARAPLAVSPEGG